MKQTKRVWRIGKISGARFLFFCDTTTLLLQSGETFTEKNVRGLAKLAKLVPLRVTM